jgi:hypothetical protein
VPGAAHTRKTINAAANKPWGHNRSSALRQWSD